MHAAERRGLHERFLVRAVGELARSVLHLLLVGVHRHDRVRLYRQPLGSANSPPLQLLAGALQAHAALLHHSVRCRLPHGRRVRSERVSRAWHWPPGPLAIPWPRKPLATLLQAYQVCACYSEMLL